jgi:hypothetical protein
MIIFRIVQNYLFSPFPRNRSFCEFGPKFHYYSNEIISHGTSFLFQPRRQLTNTLISAGLRKILKAILDVQLPGKLVQIHDEQCSSNFTTLCS